MAQELDEEGRLPLLTAGGRLREARIAAGLELDEISARTRIARRQLAALEEDRYSDLASRTYAIGFSRTYARVVGLDEEAIVGAVREEMDRQEELSPRLLRADNFEPGDPARVPSPTIAWIAGLGVIALFALLFLFWRSAVDPAAPIPDITTPPAGVASTGGPPGGPRPSAQPAGAAVGAIRLTALEDAVWIKVGDAGGEQIFQKELALGESFTLPPGAKGALLSTARPDALRIAVGARTLARLRDRPEILRDLPLEPTSLLAPRPVAPASPGMTFSAPASQTSTVTDR